MPDETIAVNRRAHHDYAIEDTLEAGIVLTGTEIKSIRAHKVNIAEAYARIENGEAWLIGAHIAEYAQGNRYNHEPTRTRKLLLHRDQIAELTGLQSAKGLTIVPLRLYLRRGRAKLELGIGARQEAPRQAPHDRRARHAARARARVEGSRPDQALEQAFTSDASCLVESASNRFVGMSGFDRAREPRIAGRGCSQAS